MSDKPLEEIARELAGSHFHVDGDNWFCCGACKYGCQDDPNDFDCSAESRRGKCDCYLEDRRVLMLRSLESARQQGRREAQTWQPIETAPKDGTPVLLLLCNPIPEPDRDDLRRFDGLAFVGSHYGDTPEVMGWSFAAPVGIGGFPERWFKGWMPLPPEPTQEKGK
jgi:hypothetical protein